MASYYVRPTDPTVVAQREREEQAREEVREHTARVAEETRRLNEAQERLEKQQRKARELLRRERQQEEMEAAAIADQVEREDRVNARARSILRERGFEGDEDLVG
jgi:hypothetical protein